MGTCCQRVIVETSDLVYIQHSGGRFIRSNLTGDGVNSGGADNYAQWYQVNFDTNGTHFKYRNLMTNKYLRIHKDNNNNYHVDNVTSEDDETGFTKTLTNNYNYLVSIKYTSESKYIGILPSQDESPPNTITVGDGDNNSRLKVLNVADMPEVYLKYGSDFDQYLVVNAVNNTAAVSTSNSGDGAIWFMETANFLTAFLSDGESNSTDFKFRNKETNHYLRIKANNQIDVEGTASSWTVFVVHNDEGYQRLESAKYTGDFVAVNPNNNRVLRGAGGTWSHMQISQVS